MALLAGSQVSNRCPFGLLVCLIMNNCVFVLVRYEICVTRWTKQAFPYSKFLSPGGGGGGGGVSFGPIQHLRGLNSMKLGYLHFTARLT